VGPSRPIEFQYGDRVRMIGQLSTPPEFATFSYYFIVDEVLYSTSSTRTGLTPRLLDRLNHLPDYRLVLISAPPGYGKTTLLSEWAVSQQLNLCELGRRFVAAAVCPRGRRCDGCRRTVESRLDRGTGVWQPCGSRHGRGHQPHPQWSGHYRGRQRRCHGALEERRLLTSVPMTPECAVFHPPLFLPEKEGLL
jgi:hypothetical protein